MCRRTWLNCSDALLQTSTKLKFLALKMNNKMLDRTFTKTEVSRSLPTKEDREAIDEVVHAPNLAALRNHLLRTSVSIRQLLL